MASIINPPYGLTQHNSDHSSLGIIPLANGSTNHSDGTNTISGSVRYFFGNNTPSSDDSAILVGRGLTGSYSSGAHAYRDETTYLASGTGLLAYASFDSIPVVSGSVAYNHIHSFQARPNYSGSGSISDISGFTWQLTHQGTGVATNLYGYRVSDPLGTGPITNHYGIWVDPLSRATNNYALYSGASTVKSYHGGVFQFGSAPVIFAANFTTYGALLSNDTTGTILSNPNITIINGVLSLKTNTAKVLATTTNLALDSSSGNVQLGGSASNVTILAPLILKNYTVATLPSASTPYQRVMVTDATAATFNATPLGGGSNIVPVFSDGTVWKIG